MYPFVFAMQHQMLNTLHKHRHFVNKEEGKSALHVSISSISAQPKPHLRWSEVELPEVTSSEAALTSIYFSSIFSISFRYSIYLSSIFSLSFHYSTYVSSICSISFFIVSNDSLKSEFSCLHVCWFSKINSALLILEI